MAARRKRDAADAQHKAAANQRAGRCGRVANGICIRLYDEKDFAGIETIDPLRDSGPRPAGA